MKQFYLLGTFPVTIQGRTQERNVYLAKGKGPGGFLRYVMHIGVHDTPVQVYKVSEEWEDDRYADVE